MNHFGTTFDETVRALRGGAPAMMGAGEEGAAPKNEKAAAWMRIIISFALLGIGTYLVIANNGSSQEVGAALFGAVTGYWFR